MRYSRELILLTGAGMLIGACHARIVLTYRSPMIIISYWKDGHYFAGRAEVSQLKILWSVIYASYYPLIKHWLVNGLTTSWNRSE